jgi:hypothetical protein
MGPQYLPAYPIFKFAFQLIHPRTQIIKKNLLFLIHAPLNTPLNPSTQANNRRPGDEKPKRYIQGGIKKKNQERNQDHDENTIQINSEVDPS